MNLSPLFLRRRMLASLASLTTMAWWRNGSAQVGSGGTGAAQSIGSADLVVGEVTLRRAGQQVTGLVKGARLLQGDLIDTRTDSEVHVAFDDGGYLAIRPNSTVRIAQYVVTGDVTDTATIDLIRGALRSVTGWIGKLDAPRYRITANTATIGVRGTDHEVLLVQAGDTAGLEPGVHNHVNEGATTLRNQSGVVNISSGTAAYSPSSGARPLRHAVVPAIFGRLRTRQESAINNHAQNIRQRMEERLRERGKLRSNERFEQFRQRQQTLRQGRADLKQPGNSAARSQAAEASKDKQAARQAMREQRQEKNRLQQESRAQKRAGQRERANEKHRNAK